MSDCKHYNSGKCVVASHLANGLDCVVNEKACEACSVAINPRQENKVTASIAAAHLYNAKIDLPDELMKILNVTTKKPIKDAPASGPGTELAKLISWFYVDSDPCRICKYRMQKMNLWGPDGCEENIDQIVLWLKQAAEKRKVPFFKVAVILLIRKAIANARRSGSGDNSSSS